MSLDKGATIKPPSDKGVLLVSAIVVAVALPSAYVWLGNRPQEGRSNGPLVRHVEAEVAWFENVLDRSNIDFVHSTGPTRFLFPEIIVGGVCAFDYDNDDDVDLYFVQGADISNLGKWTRGNRLYRNHGDGTFEDVTVAAGVGDTQCGVGCTTADHDGDGDVDLYVTNVGPNVLYQNNGDGSFSDVTDVAGVGDESFGSSSAFFDFDNDDDLDLFVVNYIRWSPGQELTCYHNSGARTYCSPNNYNAPAPDTLYRNNGDGTYTDVSDTSGIRQNFGNGLGIACDDYDGDGFPDVFVANDGMSNQLWMNDGRGGFQDEALLAGCAVNGMGAAEAGMGVQNIDIDNDGDRDLFMSHLREETNTLYQNEAGWFDDNTAVAGLGGASLKFTGFGLAFADFNHDGHLDLYIANGRVTRHDPALDPNDRFAEPNLLFSSNAPARFAEVFPRGGTTEPLVHTSRGTALADLDNDGDLDLAVANTNAKPYLLMNIAPKSGNFIQFRIPEKNGSDALNAVVMVETSRGRQYRTVQTSYGYLGSNDVRVHFGLGDAARVDNVVISWRDGTQSTFGPLRANRTHVLSRSDATYAAGFE